MIEMHGNKVTVTHYLGVDPGVKTGYAAWNVAEKRFVDFGETDFWGFIYLIEDTPRWDKHEFITEIVIEDPNLNKPVFARPNAKSMRAGMKIAQNVGSNKREASLIIEYCERNHISYQTVKPTTKKWDRDMFKAVTGIQDIVSQHVMDAAKLVVGM